MVSDTKTDGRCNAAAGPDKEGYCERYPYKGDSDGPVNGRCSSHGGKSTGAPKGNQNAKGHGAPPENANAMEHGLYSKRPAHELYPQLPDRGKDRVDTLVSAYVERWGWDWGDPRIPSRLVDVCVDVWRRWRAKGVLVDMGPNEERVVGVNDRGQPVTAWDEHHLSKQVSRVDSDIRQNFKDLAPDDPTGAGGINVESGGDLTVNFNIEEVPDDTEYIDVESEAVED